MVVAANISSLCNEFNHNKKKKKKRNWYAARLDPVNVGHIYERLCCCSNLAYKKNPFSEKKEKKNVFDASSGLVWKEK